ncbi:LysE family translocator [Thalassovita aquimarina]|uniref:LysE family translocator n=1 Tax=Thalassovita aquimarina TaxID=2785917 RepID=A0ABS5HWG9_9RHOB|nr:LysE family translocator [Thalassovita aquimarina]MBR9653322.1 LysE family translocator [Thalassovita aquimarina]
MLSFAGAVFFLIITPGPGVLSAAGMGAGYGFRPGLRYVLGLFLGTNLVALAVISGLAAVVLGMPVVRNVLLVASAGYLLYLAARIALAGSNIAFIEAKQPPGIGSGILLQIINPKAYAVNTTLFTGFAFYPGNFPVETTWKLLIMAAIWIPIHLVWLYAGHSLERLNLGARRQFHINILMALSMLVVVALALWSSFGGAQ